MGCCEEMTLAVVNMLEKEGASNPAVFMQPYILWRCVVRQLWIYRGHKQATAITGTTTDAEGKWLDCL